jgi:cyclophilin family peptidyl-prolyl cis-trans isomerase
VVPGFVIQAGSYEADGRYRGVHEPISLEANNGLKNLRGTIAMARGEPNSATAEFFINLADNPSLDRHSDDTGNSTGYAVFGRVISGMDVVDRIAAVPLGGHGPFPGAAPLTPVTILRLSHAST